MLKLTKKQLFKILIIYTLLALAAVCCYNIKKLLAPSRKRSFECYDESLRKPFAPDTVPPEQLYILGVYFPMVLIAVCELIICFGDRTSVRNFSWTLKYVLKIGVLLTLFLIGLAIERLYKNVAKIKMGRLRPNFIIVCQPRNREGYTCQDSDYAILMDEYECSSDAYPAWAVSTAFSSFPSGHTSLISYAMVFLICYLHLLFLKWRHLKSASTVIILIMQIFCFFMLLFVATSRVLDFKHHWSDVGAGFIGGSSIALALNYYLKSQLENIENWLKEVVCLKLYKGQTTKAGGKNENVTGKDETCVIELVGV